MNKEEIQNKLITINLVRGSEGYSLQIIDSTGSGYRIAGPKAWGNPLNKPTASFIVNANELINAIICNCYNGDDK